MIPFFFLGVLWHYVLGTNPCSIHCSINSNLCTYVYTNLLYRILYIIYSRKLRNEWQNKIIGDKIVNLFLSFNFLRREKNNTLFIIFQILAKHAGYSATLFNNPNKNEKNIEKEHYPSNPFLYIPSLFHSTFFFIFFFPSKKKLILERK